MKKLLNFSLNSAIGSVDGGCMPVHTTVTEKSLEMVWIMEQ